MAAKIQAQFNYLAMGSSPKESFLLSKFYILFNTFRPQWPKAVCMGNDKV